eukprot:Seg519.3 transcript_id=Seg519.3/GoldUCD/mRNA.D3Y31 product="hypothetical protein" protein_id=Seg519.3/GoldUCD/D3Y31
MQSLSLSKLQTQADAAAAQSQLLLTAAKARNVTHPSIRFYLRSETLGSAGISSPPRSKIEIDGVDYNKDLDGFNIAVVDVRTGIVESSSNFRIDIDPNAGRQLVDFLAKIQTGCAYLASDVLHNERTRSRGLTYPCLVLKYCAGGDPHVMLAEIVLPIAALKPYDTRRWY